MRTISKKSARIIHEDHLNRLQEVAKAARRFILNQNAENRDRLQAATDHLDMTCWKTKPLNDDQVRPS